MLYVIESANVNMDTFNESIGFHILPNFGPHGGYLKWLFSEIRSNKYHNVEMIRDSTGANLEGALMFQKNLTEAVVLGLENCFDDHGIQ
jgi:hypothetical protein